MFWKSVRAMSGLVDNALATAVAVPLDWQHQRNRENAMKDREYAEIASRRAGKSDITWQDLRKQHQLLGQYSANPWWEGPLQVLARRPVTQLARAGQFAWQRVSRGWDDSAAWSLDVSLARTLGQQLNHLAQTTHGWPSDEYPRFEEWQIALRHNAALLLAYAEGKFALPRGDSDRELAVSVAESEKQYAEAQQALKWVADNLGYLWD